MIQEWKRGRVQRRLEDQEGREGLRRIATWIHVFRGEAEARIPRDEAKLCADMAMGRYSCVGKSHSYNGVQIVPGVNAMMMREGGLDRLDYDPATGIATVGASVSVEQLKLFLLGHKRRLINSGNYMQQTVVGALATGTHGFGDRAVMADAVTSVTFLDDSGQRHTLSRGDPEFPYVALSFGTIAPIVELSLETVPTEAFISTSHVNRLSNLRALQKGAIASNWCILPYTDLDDPVMMLHALSPFDPAVKTKKERSGGGFFAPVARWVIGKYQWLDRWVPKWRRPLQRFIHKLNVTQVDRIITDPEDLDYLYDPKKGQAKDRAPDILRGCFSTTYTGYNLAFFVPLEKAPAIVKFIIREADGLRDLGFFLKGVISVRELPGTSDLVFAANHTQPMAAIDLFADPRDYAWLERLQRLVMQYEPDTRPHFGKSALMPEMRDSLGEQHLDRLMAIHRRHYPQGRLMFSERVRAFLQTGKPLPGEPAADANLA
ncbi:FAD-binding protein [Qipengyuania sp. 6B39]|uniref:FAD-binding protein n=1 Tax=Qipengyuania proteolytica TaxID=2867239 RepID=UPI001C8ADE2A|nr:FAD-binding protein [Qipengyuania proteolytica]MBX7496284.1 FAD-binding protein [Qipengyuania proteolytica]